jgi:hypothetical protein
MQINLIFDSRAQAAPQSFRDAIQAAANVLDATFTDNITVNISVGYGEIDGQSESSTGASAGPSNGVFDSYSQVRTWLVQHASSDVQSGVSVMPTGSSIQGQSQVVVWRAQERLMGQVPASDSVLDGSAGFGTGIATNLLEGVALHELTHAMGRVPYDGSQPDIFDLYRFSSAGTYLFGNAQPTAAASYFSLDGGRTDLADYGRTSDPSDFLNSSGRTPNDPFNEFYNASTVQALSHIDILQMEALGFHAAPSAPPAPAPPPMPAQVHANDLTYAGTASGYNHFIDLLNFEASYPDLVHAFGTNQQAMENWYNANEPAERRIESFDGLDYVASYSDLITAYRSAGSMHAVQDAGATDFINNGLAQGRNTTFNGLDYIASYRDLIAAFGANSDAGAYHYIENGSTEGRTTTFDGLDYIASYGDLIRAFGANEQAGAAHFIANGVHEGRTTTFDGLSYIAQYTDLMTAFGANNDAGATHYITNGMNEHRSTGFDVVGYERAHPDLQGQYATNDQFLAAYINTYVTTGHFLT